MDDSELMSARLLRTCIYVIHITYEEIQPSTYEKQPVEKIVSEMPVPHSLGKYFQHYEI